MDFFLNSLSMDLLNGPDPAFTQRDFAGKLRAEILGFSSDCPRGLSKQTFLCTKALG